MSKSRFWRKVVRPEQSFFAAAAAIVVFLVSSQETAWALIMALGMSVFFNVAGASLFHYGAAKKMYARKYWDRVDVSRPKQLIILGLHSFLVSLLISILFLPLSVTLILLLNALLILLYSRLLSQYWTTKNIVAAFVCSTPPLLGLLAAGSFHSWMLVLVLSVFFCYVAREIIKDINDIEANHGLRVTLPIWLKSKNKAMYVAYFALFLAVGCLVVLKSFFSVSFIAYALFWLAIIQLLLVPFITQRKGTQVSPNAISLSNAFMLISVIFTTYM